MTISHDNNTPRLAAVIGRPIKHSLSPLIHQTWADREGAPAFYQAIEPPDTPQGFQDTVHRMKREGYRGANVTIPYKEEALALADQASPAATAIGAANMLTFKGATIIADNSDAIGFTAAVKSAAVIPDRARGLVLGAGGAARAIVYALVNHLALAEIVIANRTRSRADQLAASFRSSDVSIEIINWRDIPGNVANADIIINTSSLGMTGQPPLDIDLSSARSSAVVVDIVYSPMKTDLLIAAERQNLVAINGLEMLMRQAVPGYRQWLGNTAEVDDDLRTRLKNALAARNQGRQARDIK